MMLRRDGIGGNGFRMAGGGVSPVVGSRSVYATFDGIGATTVEPTVLADNQCIGSMITPTYDITPSRMRTYVTLTGAEDVLVMGIYLAALGAAGTLLAQTASVPSVLGIVDAPLIAPITLTAGVRYYLALSTPLGVLIAGEPALAAYPGDGLAFMGGLRVLRLPSCQLISPGGLG